MHRWYKCAQRLDGQTQALDLSQDVERECFQLPELSRRLQVKEHDDHQPAGQDND